MDRFKRQKRLCFIVPLLPNRTNLSIFNDTDMTISLTTSAGKLQDDVEHIMHSNSTRSDAIKDRVSQSRQARWLKRGNRGTHIFVMKIAERSRALDWYWELWRDLGGDLPTRVDIYVPALTTTVRLEIPDDEDMVGSKRVCSEMSPKNAIKTCWDMMGKTVDLQDLLDHRSDRGGDLDLELAWKASDGALDWLAHSTTVCGKARDWALLASIVKVNVIIRPVVGT